MTKSLEQLLFQSIDYSGFFLSEEPGLRTTLRNYVNGVNSEYSELISKLVIPHNEIPKLGAFSDRKKELNGPLSICTRGPETNTLDDFKNVMRSIQHEILSVHSAFPGDVRTNTLELKLPTVSVQNLNVEELIKALEAVVINAANSKLLPHRVYFEVPGEALDSELVKKITKVIAVHNRSILKRKINNYLFSGLKINCGDNGKASVPTADFLADIMLYARDANVAVKFSGGVNESFPTLSSTTKTQVHGFINLFVAGVMAYTQDLDVEETVEILEDSDPNNFKFEEGYLSWKNFKAPAMEIKMLRMLSLTSFSCKSFTSPLEQLKESGLL